MRRARCRPRTSLEAMSSDQSSSERTNGFVSASQRPRTSARPAGSSRFGKCAARGSVSMRECGISACASMPCWIGIVRSLLAPDDQRLDRAQEIQAVDRRDLLAVDVDHRAERLEERLARARILKRAKRAGDRPEVDGIPPPRLAASRGDAVEHAEDAPVRSRPDEAGRAGQRGAAEHRAHLLAEAAARDQRKPLDLVGELVEELHRDPAAERVADERRRLDRRSPRGGRGSPPRGRRSSSRRGPPRCRRGRSGRGRSPCASRRA